VWPVQTDAFLTQTSGFALQNLDLKPVIGRRRQLQSGKCNRFRISLCEDHGTT
jgi:hypothetical protein